MKTLGEMYQLAVKNTLSHTLPVQRTLFPLLPVQWRHLFNSTIVKSHTSLDRNNFAVHKQESCFIYLFFFWQLVWHVEIHGPGIDPKPQQQPEPRQWQCLILNPLSHQKTPRILLCNKKLSEHFMVLGVLGIICILNRMWFH